MLWKTQRCALNTNKNLQVISTIYCKNWLTSCMIFARSVGGSRATCSGVIANTCIITAYDTHNLSLRTNYVTKTYSPSALLVWLQTRPEALGPSGVQVDLAEVVFRGGYLTEYVSAEESSIVGCCYGCAGAHSNGEEWQWEVAPKELL